MKSIIILSLLSTLFISCGDTEQSGKIGTVNRQFVVEELSKLSTAEDQLRDSLCATLQAKKDIFISNMMNKTFELEASFKHCDETTAVAKDLSLSLDSTSSGVPVYRLSSSERLYSFTGPEFLESSSTFSKFCADKASNLRYTKSSTSLYVLEIQNLGDTTAITLASAVQDGERDGKVNYTSYKVEKLTYTKHAEFDKPAGLVVSRTLSSKSNCANQNELEIKKNTLKSIRD